MKIKQDDAKFKPITITFEAKEEAEAFFELMNKVCGVWAHVGGDLKPDMINKKERSIAIDLANAETTGVVRI